MFDLSTDVSKLLFRFLSDNGASNGNKNMNGDYSITPDEFYFTVANGPGAIINRLTFHIEDTTGIQYEEYGNLGSALTNGYTIKVKDDSGSDVLDLCDGTLIKSNADIGKYCYDIGIIGVGAGDDMLQARWTLSKTGQPLFLPNGYRLSITLNDDFTGLIEHEIMVQGFYLYDGQF